MKRRFAAFASALALIWVTSALAQPGSGGGMPAFTGTITGEVRDTALDKPIEYATIVLFSLRDSSQVTGTITDSDGIFIMGGIRPGRYYAKVGFLGYNTTDVDDIRLGPQSPAIDLGIIDITQAVMELEEVNYAIERAPVEYQIDKKVIRVDKQPTAASGTAVEILENVPSISVDIEGNVELRGSGNFTVLIDGRPTVMDGNDALQQTPASSIESIEIITNPSAKYDPDGTSGIINIILKKNQAATTSGMVSLSYGSNNRKGGDVLVSRRYNGTNLILGANLNNRKHVGHSFTENRTTVDDVTSTYLSEGDAEGGRESWSFRGSLEMNLGEKNWLNVGGDFGQHSGGRTSDLAYDSWVDTLTTHTLYSNVSEDDRKSDYYSAFAEYRHNFGAEEHELVARIQSSRDIDDQETVEELYDETGAQSSGRVTTEDGPSQRTDVKFDYTYPHGDDQKLEIGYQARLEANTDETTYKEYDAVAASYVTYPQFAYNVEYDRLIQSAYAVYGGKAGNLGYQAGLRGEFTDREITLVDSSDSYVLSRSDVYPTVHFSYQLPGSRQLMASYSRRVNRARSYFLEPFYTWRDANNIYRGDPDIEPEKIDSWEAGYQIPLGPFSHSLEAYYRVTHDLVEFTRSVYAPGITLNQPTNVGTAYAFGSEMMFSGEVSRWLIVNLMGNLYQNRIESTLAGSEGTTEDFSWNGRLSLTFRLPQQYRLQTTVVYNSPVVTSQGRREEFFMTNLAFEKSFFNRSLTGIVQVRDIFQTVKRTRITEGPNLYIYRKFTMDSPAFFVTLRYNINHFRDQKRNGEGEGGMEETSDFME